MNAFISVDYVDLVSLTKYENNILVVFSHGQSIQNFQIKKIGIFTEYADCENKSPQQLLIWMDKLPHWC